MRCNCGKLYNCYTDGYYLYYCCNDEVEETIQKIPINKGIEFDHEGYRYMDKSILPGVRETRLQRLTRKVDEVLSSYGY